MLKVQGDNLRIRTAERLAELFNQKGIRYAVVNGLYFYPEDIGRDLDIVIHPEDVPLAILISDQVKNELGWEYLVSRWSHYGVWQLYFVSRGVEQVKWLELDLMCRSRNLALGLSLPFYVESILTSGTDYRGPFRVSRVGEYFKGYFRPVYYGDINRFKDRYPLKAPETRELREALNKALGDTLFQEYMRKISSSVEELQQWSRTLKWRLNLRYACQHPLSALRNLLWTRFLRPLFLYLFNAGLVIAVVGPDGVGKSTAIQEAVRYLDGLFDIRVRHWRPGFLPAPSTLLGKSKQNKAGSPNRTRPGTVEHWFRILYYWLDYTLGYLLKDRFLPKSVIQLVLYDRHALDTAVDPVRYRLASARGTEILYRFIPRPHKVILLRDSADRILQRKQELSKEEIEEQLQKWEEFVEQGLVDIQIYAGTSPEETGQRIALEVLKAAYERFDLHKSAIGGKL